MNRVAILLTALAIVSTPARGAESWQGRWSIDPIGCSIDGDTAETAPLIATPTTLRWFVANCQIRKIYKTDAGVHIQARCSAEGETNSTPITLDPRGDRMRVTWNRSRVQDMRRCK